MAEVSARELPARAKQFYEKGNAAMDRGKPEHAIKMFMESLKLEPRFLTARGKIRFLEITKAREKKGRMISISTIAGAGSVKKYLKKDPLRALEEAENLLQRDVTNVQFLLAYADASIAAEVPEAGAQALEMTREFHPEKNEAILERLAELYREMGEHAKEREIYTELLRRNPNDQEYVKAAKNAAAQDTIKSKNYEKAVETGNFREALRDEEQAKELEQNNRATKSSSDLEARVERLVRVIESEPENLNNYKQLADTYSTMEQYDDALEVYEKVSEMTGGGDPEIERSIATMNIRIHETSIEYYEEHAEEVFEDDDGVEFSGADMAEYWREALEEFRIQDAAACVERYPNDNQYKFLYGQLLYQQGEYDQAIPLFQKSRNHPKVRHEALHHLSLCYKEKGIFDIAAETLREPIADMPLMNEQKKVMLYDLGLIYEQMDRDDDAKDCFKQIYMIDYEYRDVADRIEGRATASA